MKTAMTVQELAQTVVSHASGKEDLVAPSPVYRFGLSDDRAIRLELPGRQSMAVLPNAQAQVTDFLQIPRRFATLLQTKAPELLLENLNGLMAKAEGRRMVRTLDGQARAFLSDGYACIDNEIIVDGLYPRIMGMGARIVSCNVGDDYMHIKAVMDMQGEIRKGDVVRWGFSLRNSEVGKGAFSLDPFLERLVCTNGMVVTDHSRRRAHIGGRYLEGDGSWVALSSETQTLKMRAVIAEMSEHMESLGRPEIFQKVLGNLREVADQPIPAEPQMVVESVAARYSLAKPEADSCLIALAEGRDYTRWGLANAVTLLANTTESYDRATELETLGGRIMQLSARDYSALSVMPRRTEILDAEIVNA